MAISNTNPRDINKAAAISTVASLVLSGTTGLQRAYGNVPYTQQVLNNFTREAFGVTMSELITSLRETRICPCMPGRPRYVRGVRLDRAAKDSIRKDPRVAQLNGESAALMSDGSLLVDVLFDGDDRRHYIMVDYVENADKLQIGLLSNLMQSKALNIGLHTICMIIESATVYIDKSTDVEKALFV